MEQYKDPKSTESSSKKKPGQEKVKADREENNMMPSIFAACHPISNIKDIDGVLKEPPRWVKRVEPLVPRAPTVVQNYLKDCHIDCNNYLTRRRLDSRIVPKTLICHDYKGGYQADKYLHYPNEEILGHGYPFYNWAQIDIFVYFSHHLITIPPLCWINLGHKNGVKVLGTFITESDNGAVICEKLLKNMETMHNFAHSLAKLTEIFGFDGWLLNIENNIENVEILRKFVGYLTHLLHSDNPGNLVIWYDSVTIEGTLKWQNQLNTKNRCFFDACDGIFLNYSWTEEHLKKTVEVAEHRNLDVFVGIDVFGRNMFGGGKMNTYKAAEMITRYNLSIAIFAPGWTHEKLENDTIFEQFVNKDSAFWCSLWTYFYTHPISNYFTTNFYIGLDKTCYNMFSQQQQLSEFLYPSNPSSIESYETIAPLINRCDCMQAVTLGSRNACLITKKNLRRGQNYTHRLFVCDIKISENTLVFYLSKNVNDDLTMMSITILTCDVNGKFKKIKLFPDWNGNALENESLLEVNPSEAIDVYESVKSRYLKMIEEEQWILRIYIFSTGPCSILEVGATIADGDSIYLGGFGIVNADGDFLKTK